VWIPTLSQRTRKDGAPRQECNRCFGRLAEVVEALSGDNHLGFQSHLIGVSIADAMEQVPNVAGSASFVADG
jgi:hypothetical protein